MMRVLGLAITLLSFALGCGCGRTHDHQETAGHASTHQHAAPHGGKLIEVGNHQFNVELVHDPAAGTLTLYTLDAHAETFVRTAMPAIELSVVAGSQTHTLNLLPVANAATGETVGATSQYEASAAWLKGASDLTGTMGLLDFNGVKFSQVPFGQ